MHPDLSPHLHTEECNILIKQLHECHNTKTISKFWGACSDIDREVVKCLRKEREMNRKKNEEEGKKRRERMRQKLELLNDNDK